MALSDRTRTSKEALAVDVKDIWIVAQVERSTKLAACQVKLDMILDHKNVITNCCATMCLAFSRKAYHVNFGASGGNDERERPPTIARSRHAYADEVGCALGSGPRQQPSRLWRDLEACELLLRVLLPGPALLRPIDVERLQAGERRRALAENPGPRQRLGSSEGTAERP